ncbi:MAG TPA: hypothetical protein VMR50_09715 [Myxococcota bacterium]|nr:hypothetical protein [Myxococcota bacterium]
MPDEFSRRGQALAEAFFNKRNQELLEKLRAQEAAKRKRAELTAATGIEDVGVLDELVAAGIDGSTLAAMSLAPLVLMAWRDGKIETHERAAVLRAAEQRGFKQGSTGFQLVESWLDTRPKAELLPAWESYVKSLRQKLSPSAFGTLRDEVVTHTREVARQARGLLNIHTMTQGEKELLAKIEAALA